MNKIATLLGFFAFMSLTGCATQEYVRSQTEPLADSIGKLENKVNGLEAKEAQPAKLSDADRAMIRDADAKAQKALDELNSLSAEVKKASEDAKKAQEAAKDAETAEKKSEKLFKLEQKK